MFHFDVSPMERCSRIRLTPLHTAHLVASAAVAIATCLTGPVAGMHPQQSQAKPADPKQDAARPDGEAERKLLAALDTAFETNANHPDAPKLDRELAAAFRTYGLDLDTVDPKAAGTRLANRPATPELAAAIDQWCRLRQHG